MKQKMARVTTPTMPIWYSIVLLLGMVVALAGSGIMYTKSVADDLKSEIAEAEHEREQGLCGVIDASLRIDPGEKPPAMAPPTLPADQRRAFQEMLNLRNRLECP